MVILLCAPLALGSPALTPAILLAGRKPVDGVEMVIGQVTKHPANPLFIQDKPWEPRLDNGCESCIATDVLQ